MSDSYRLINGETHNVLHVLHSWGGGIDFFAQDLKLGDTKRTHFFLKSHSYDNAAPFGKELCLYESLTAAPIARWLLWNPTNDTDLASEEVAGILQSIVEKWTIDAVIVSSLIGHSLDVLKTGLPTALAIHDVYPYWPLLHDANTGDYSEKYLACALENDKEKLIFQAHDAAYWIAIKDTLIKVIKEFAITCVSPSEFAKARVIRIAPELAHASWRLIPHGVNTDLQLDSEKPKTKHKKLHVLIPGHINGAKGEDLLRELLPSLPDDIECVLLGSAHLGEQFSRQNIDHIPHYRRQDIGVIVDQLQPDIALLASTVPETYGYVLSEMLQLGVPVICSDIGAYAERGKHLPGVYLVEPQVSAFRKVMLMLRDDREKLIALKKGLPYSFPSLHDMADSWAEVLPIKRQSPPEIENLKSEQIMDIQITHLAKILKQVHVATEINSQACAQQKNNMQKAFEKLDEQQHINSLRDNQQALQSQTLQVIQDKMQQLIETFSQREQESQQRIEKLNIDIEKKLQDFQHQAMIERSQFIEQQDALNGKVLALNEQLTKIQSTRVWRLMRFFK
jgi:O-antigen biosynthesis protein